MATLFVLHSINEIGVARTTSFSTHENHREKKKIACSYLFFFFAVVGVIQLRASLMNSSVHISQGSGSQQRTNQRLWISPFIKSTCTASYTTQGAK